MNYAEKHQQRKRAAELFASGHTQAAVARILGVSRMSASRWHRAWKRGGESALLGTGRVGAKPRIPDEGLRVLHEILASGPAELGFDSDRWTLARIAEVIERECGTRYHPSQVRKILNALGWFHRPRGKPRRGSKTGTGPFKWRRYRHRRTPGRRGESGA